MNKTLKDFSLLELKAMAYDQLVAIDQVKVNINAINQEISNRMQEGTEMPAKSTADEVKQDGGNTETETNQEA